MVGTNAFAFADIRRLGAGARVVVVSTIVSSSGSSAKPALTAIVAVLVDSGNALVVLVDSVSTSVVVVVLVESGAVVVVLVDFSLVVVVHVDRSVVVAALVDSVFVAVVVVVVVVGAADSDLVFSLFLRSTIVHELGSLSSEVSYRYGASSESP